MSDEFEFDPGPEPLNYPAPLEPCPYNCEHATDGVEVHAVTNNAGMTMYQVRCKFCKARGPLCSTHYRAGSEWGIVSDAVWK